VIQSFRHAGLRKIWEKGKSRKINPQWTLRIRARLTALQNAGSIEDIDLPGYKLHELKGESAGTWAIWVTGNWRMTFQPEETAESFDIHDVNLEDYH
jgi:proteic killer suppression protein